MGSARWDPKDWATHSTATAGMSRAAIFTASSIHADLDPKNITFRESVDSAANPNSTPVIIAVDETGSMGLLAETIIKKDLGLIVEEIYERKPVTDPHILCMGIGDAYVDSAPLQVTQFEASIVLVEQLKNIYLEGGGGGNEGESYLLAHYFTAFKTKCDAQTKRKRKGYLFTIGDEPPLLKLTKGQVKRFIGDDVEADLSARDLIDILKPNWEVFHLIIKPVDGRVVPGWRELLGERAIVVSDHTKLGEVIVSTMQVVEGADVGKVIDSWSGDTALVVRDAVGALTKTGDVAAGVRRL